MTIWTITTAGKTLYHKIWDAHLVATTDDGEAIHYVDLRLINEVTSAQAFAGLIEARRKGPSPLALAETSRRTAILTIVVQVPRNPDRLRANPSTFVAFLTSASALAHCAITRVSLNLLRRCRAGNAPG